MVIAAPKLGTEERIQFFEKKLLDEHQLMVGVLDGLPLALASDQQLLALQRHLNRWMCFHRDYQDAKAAFKQAQQYLLANAAHLTTIANILLP